MSQQAVRVDPMLVSLIVLGAIGLSSTSSRTHRAARVVVRYGAGKPQKRNQVEMTTGPSLRDMDLREKAIYCKPGCSKPV
jgi:hypothetical protein